jgi:hypothetical protein
VWLAGPVSGRSRVLPGAGCDGHARWRQCREFKKDGPGFVVAVSRAWFAVVSGRVLVRVVLAGSWWRDMGEARRITVRF